jgi:hypothetical protein
LLPLRRRLQLQVGIAKGRLLIYAFFQTTNLGKENNGASEPGRANAREQPPERKPVVTANADLALQYERQYGFFI